ncbi:large neutral amino acids transporter small subunit 2-like [Tropilaelaps mercedesae]|uniref:Large neutral amino acids transporter small subunit 2-like n=1 Tax=Tropilaelaps mercedesae TaxID=418985 RepID=A0A1V9XBD2_9ACAR|nr:large neutral amino acids transporter small subunit 2-like [Tropilaelaps mercedesae]
MEDMPLRSGSPRKSLRAEQGADVKLVPQLGVLSGVSLIVGSIIGSGIFVSPTGVVRYAGSPGLSLIVWLLTGVVCTIGALCYSELGTTIPKSGADFAYIHAAFGELAAFLFLWVSLIVLYPMSNAVGAITFAQYSLQPIATFLAGNGCPQPDVPENAVKLIAALMLSE